MSNFIEDGQHRIDKQAYLEIDENTLKLLKKHLKICPVKPVVDEESEIPLEVIVDKSGSNVYCGFCKKKLGKCSVKEK